MTRRASLLVTLVVSVLVLSAHAVPAQAGMDTFTYSVPEPQMKTDPINRICHIDKWIILDASLTTDNVDDVNAMTFKWDLDIIKDTDYDGITNNDVDATGAIINFTPKFIGPIPIGLNVSEDVMIQRMHTTQKPERLANADSVPNHIKNLDMLKKKRDLYEEFFQKSTVENKVVINSTNQTNYIEVIGAFK